MCCPRRVSLCRMQLPEARFDLPLRRGLGTERQSWLRGHGWGLGAGGFRAPNPAFPAKENPWGVRFGLRRPPGKQQGPGSQRLPSPALPDLHWRAGCQNGLRAFLSIGAVGLVCAARRAFQVPLQTAAPRSSVGAVGETGPRCCAVQLVSGGIAGAWAQNAFPGPILLPREGEHV